MNCRRAVAHLKRVDPVMARIIDAVGPCRYFAAVESRTGGTHFHAILRSITYQQLSTKAAATIHGRVLALYGPDGPTPQEILDTPDERLRAAGLSRQKTAYIKDLAAHDLNGAIDRIDALSDEEVIATLIAVKGVGRWTAQMVLMFRLSRLNIVPELDLGIQKAIQRAYGKRKKPTPKQVTALGARWAPYGTIASWYLWRSLDLPVKPRPAPAVTAKRAPSRARSRTRPAPRRTAAASRPSPR
jgi:DNA-3-methyladenine glycosylase II